MMETVSFASARRIDPDAVRYARQMIHKGYGFQNAARISGVSEASLRELVGAAAPRVTPPPPPPRPARLPNPARKLTSATCETSSIIARVAAKYGLTPADLAGESRLRRVAYARHEAIWTVRQARPHLSLPALGRIFGGRDHSTIHYAIEVHACRMAWADILVSIADGVMQPDLFAVAA